MGIEQAGDVVIVDLGPWESTTLDAWMESAPFELLEQGERRFVFDLTRCPHVGSGILAELVAFYWSGREVGAAAVVAATRTQRSLFELTKLDEVFEIFGSVDEAVASLRDRESGGSRRERQ